MPGALSLAGSVAKPALRLADEQRVEVRIGAAGYEQRGAAVPEGAGGGADAAVVKDGRPAGEQPVVRQVARDAHVRGRSGPGRQLGPAGLHHELALEDTGSFHRHGHSAGGVRAGQRAGAQDQRLVARFDEDAQLRRRLPVGNPAVQEPEARHGNMRVQVEVGPAEIQAAGQQVQGRARAGLRDGFVPVRAELGRHVGQQGFPLLQFLDGRFEFLWRIGLQGGLLRTKRRPTRHGLQARRAYQRMLRVVDGDDWVPPAPQRLA